MAKFHRYIFVLILILAYSQNARLTAQDMSVDKNETPEIVLNKYFEVLTFKGGETPDWERLKSLFLEDAVIVYRLGPNTLRTFDREGFIEYMEMDINRTNLLKSGLILSPLKNERKIIKKIAVCNILYEVKIPGVNNGNPVNRGFSSFHLVYEGQGWYITSIINEGFSLEEDFPDFRDEKE